MENWILKKQKQENCLHQEIKCVAGRMSNGRPIMRFRCMECEEMFGNLQMNVNDNDRKISSMKHPKKTLAQIKEIDAPYLFWVAVKSKMGQPDRYACARVFIASPYFIPADGAIIRYDDLYQHFVKKAVDFIKENGGTL